MSLTIMTNKPDDHKLIDARLTILEYRQDELERDLKETRTEYASEHKALRLSLQGIEKNLTAIRWATTGAVGAVVAQTIGVTELILKLF